MLQIAAALSPPISPLSLLLLLLGSIKDRVLAETPPTFILPSRHLELTESVAVKGDLVGNLKTLDYKEYLEYKGYEKAVEAHGSVMPYEEYTNYRDLLHQQRQQQASGKVSGGDPGHLATISFEDFASAKRALGLWWDEALTYDQYRHISTSPHVWYGDASPSGRDFSQADAAYVGAIERYRSGVVVLLAEVAKLQEKVDVFCAEQETYPQLKEAATSAVGGGSEKAYRRIELIDLILTSLAGGSKIPSELKARVIRLHGECRHLIHEMFRLGEANDKLCVHCLMLDGKMDGSNEFDHLYKVYWLSKAPSPATDAIVQDYIIDGLFVGYHDPVTKTLPIELKRGPDVRVGVAGLSSAGLLSTVELLLAQFPVLAFESRPRQHAKKRKRLAELSSRWNEELRWLLGTEYSRLLNEKIATQIRSAPRNEIGLCIELCDLEEVLRGWLKNKFLARVKERFGQQSGWDHKILEMCYGKEVVGMKLPTTEDPHFKFVVKEGLREGTEPEVIDQPLAGVIIATGKDDDMCNTYLGVPKVRTRSKNYFVVVVEKGSNLLKANLRVLPVKMASLTSAHDVYAAKGVEKHFKKMVDGMGKVLTSARDQQLCGAQRTMERFQHLGQLIVNGVDGEEDGVLAGNKVLMPNPGPSRIEKIGVTHVMDRGLRFQVDGVAPSVLMDFNDSLDAELVGKNKAEKAGCVQMRECIHRLYFDFVLKYSVGLSKTFGEPTSAAHPDEIEPVDKSPTHTFLNINEYGELKPVGERNPDGLHFDIITENERLTMSNASMFKMALAALPQPASYLFVHGVLAFFLAVGDASSLAHFHTGLGVKKIAAEVQVGVGVLSSHYPRPEAPSESLTHVPEWAEKMVSEQNEALISIGNYVLTASEGHIDHYNDWDEKDRAEMEAVAMRDVCDLVNRLHESKPYSRGKAVGELEVFAIECDEHHPGGDRRVGQCVSPAHPHFRFHLHAGEPTGAAAVDVRVAGEYLSVDDGKQRERFLYALLHAGLYGANREEYIKSGGIFVPHAIIPTPPMLH